ncbi:MAG: class I SAM-dependent rRNA methyltransferase [Thermogutta sp.]|nr:class I SAM-dependent rRNA methyltransferase [Thermogutta sp.]HPU06370.1 class I SAM-dependent rRNA methyltransferase [Thermogutta sp.]
MSEAWSKKLPTNMNHEVCGRIVIRPDRVRPFLERHPWVRATSIELIEGAPPDGSVVDVVSRQGKFIARGIFNSRSQIRVRLYTWQDQPLDEPFWRHRLESAIALRRQLGLDTPNGATRLVFSESDGLSGLIIDKYRDFLVLQVNALGFQQRLETIVGILQELLNPKGIIARTDMEIRDQEGITFESPVTWGNVPPGPILVQEHGLDVGVDLLSGQKTGLYLDQRDNRLAAARLVKGKRVLDMFCYTGGFSLVASRCGQAKEVWGFDSSEKAIVMARANAQQNGVTNTRFEVGDAFQTLKSLRQEEERFDVVILDPPKFASGKSTLPEAFRAYHYLNRLAIDVLNPGGYLVTCSCSGYVTREDFFNVLFGVSQQVGRDIQILEQRGAAPDHPVLVTCRETHYLKCFICRVL